MKDEVPIPIRTHVPSQFARSVTSQVTVGMIATHQSQSQSPWRIGSLSLLRAFAGGLFVGSIFSRRKQHAGIQVKTPSREHANHLQFITSTLVHIFFPCFFLLRFSSTMMMSMLTFPSSFPVASSVVALSGFATRSKFTRQARVAQSL